MNSPGLSGPEQQSGAAAAEWLFLEDSSVT